MSKIYLTFIKDRTISQAITIDQSNGIDIRINPSLFKLNSNTIDLQKTLYYAGFGATIIAKSTHIIRELSAKRNLLTASIQI
jgi:phosphotransferase system HPr-like phosphotransfer protein